MKCRLCLYWRPLDTHTEADLTPGHCHRYPPVALNNGHDAASLKRDAGTWTFPVVYAMAWCGEFREKS